MPLNSRFLDIPRCSLNKENGFSMDYGNTLIKLVYICEDKNDQIKGDNVRLYMESFMVDQLDDALDLIKKEVTLIPGGSYQMSGVGVTLKKDLIEEKLNIKISVVGEWQSFIRGFQYMKANFPEEDFTLPSDLPHMKGMEMYYTNVRRLQKTGGSIPVSWDGQDDITSDATMMFMLGSAGFLIKINADGTHSIVSMIFSAGKTLTGVGSLLSGAKNFDELMSLASAGDVSNVSITLPDMLNINKDSTDGKDKTGKDAVVFHYGKVSQANGYFKKEDLAAAWLRHQIEYLVHLSYLACNSHKVRKMYLCGGMIEGSQTIRKEFEKTWEIHTQLGFYRPVEMKLLKYSGYLGAVGALIREDSGQDFDDLMERIKDHWKS